MFDLLLRVSRLPEHFMVFYLTISRDGNERAFKAPEALAMISREMNAPVYGVFETDIGAEIVGGHLISYSIPGARTAREAIRILAGEKPENGESPAESGNRYIFDARELKR